LNVEAYISSGIIESYVLGLATTEEKIELELTAATFEAVKTALKMFEQMIEEEAIKHAIPPPKHLKNDLMKTLQIKYD